MDLCWQSDALSMFFIAFLPRSKSLLISWLQSLSTVILEPKKIKSDAVSTFSPCICHEVMERNATILVFGMLSFKPAFRCPLSPSSRRAQTNSCVHQDPGDRSSDPTREWAGPACECLRISGRGVGWHWPAAGVGALPTTVWVGAHWP